VATKLVREKHMPVGASVPDEDGTLSAIASPHRPVVAYERGRDDLRAVRPQRHREKLARIPFLAEYENSRAPGTHPSVTGAGPVADVGLPPRSTRRWPFAVASRRLLGL
jgi:hypothetical protein